MTALSQSGKYRPPIVFMALLLSWSIAGCSPPVSITLSSVQVELEEGHLEQAELLARQGLSQQKQTASSADDWHILLAEIAIRRGIPHGCLDELKSLSVPPRLESGDALASLGQIGLDAGSVEVAEVAWRLALQADPQNRSSSVNLGYLLGFEGRCWEAAPLYFAAVKGGYFTQHHLILLGASDPVIEDSALRTRCLAAFPDVPLPRLGEARTAIRLEQYATAEEILKHVVLADPQCDEAQGQLGQLIAFTRPDTFSTWHAKLTSTANFHPEVWVARGLMARQLGQSHGAMRCFWEAIQLAPNHRVAHFQLGQVLVALNRLEEAQTFLDRASQLQSLAEQVDAIFRHPTDVARLESAMEVTEQLGRDWEAWAWASSARQLNPRCEWANAAISRIETRLSPNSPQVSSEVSPAQRHDYSKEPLPDFSPSQSPRLATTPAPTFPAAKLVFEDQAESTRLNFVYHTRGPHDASEMRMYETTGGGVAVLDIDVDSFPDLYFTQAGCLTPGIQAGEVNDCCFRNRDGTAWQNVTQAAGLSDADYGQGVTAGDFDNDGFVDLYVANLGRNRLYQNQGDGTFLDVTQIAGLPDLRWTTSCLMADLNSDGFPDLYDVNYLSREDAIRATCRVGEELQWCNPESFAAEQDQLFLNSGDGHFRDVTSVAGIERPQGKGLGVVAADFDNSSRLSLFVANDAVPNFLFVNRATPGEVPQFVESALLKGLAVDADGLPQACMGVAAGDLDGDRLLDLFVTNFYEQSNTLYLQRPGFTFDDATRSAGLRQPSWNSLGFGTQCFDPDLDGWLDLVVTNGHVLDLSAKGVPFRMRPQFYRNLGRGVFQEQVATDLGAFFQRDVLGRGLAKLDWNRDGLPDFVVSNIESPASLVTNDSRDTGHWFAVQLIGVQGSRDAIGAVVTIRAGELVWSQQLTAGDGYQCRNECRLLFGLGPADRIDSWSIRWPSGTTQEYPATLANRNVLVVEGHSADLTVP